jgi:predicted permease
MLNRLRSLGAALFRRDRFEDAMRDEMQFHIEAYADDLVAAGVPRQEADRRARVAFGGTERVKEECRQARGVRLLDELRQDVRYGLRSMVKAPAFTIAAVMSIALGIGANTAIFTLMDAVLIRSMPIADPGELYFIGHDPGPNASMSANYPMFERYRDAGIFSGVTVYDMRSQGFRVVTEDGAETVDGQFVSGNYHALVGVPFVLGRGFSSEHDRTASTDFIAVISDSYWTRRFGRSPDVIGKTLTIRERKFTIVGVTAPAFYSLDPGVRADVTLPISIKVLDEKGFLDSHTSFTSLRIVGRLRKGMSETQALAAVDTVFHQFMSEPEQQWVGPSSKSFRAAALIPASRGSNDLRRQYATSLNVLMGMVALVLLIGCANVANLLLARATARTKEVAVRLGVGAGRARLVRQFLTESLLVAIAGGALGFVLAFVSARAIVSLFNVGPISVLLDVNPSATVLVFTTLVSVVTGIAFGLVPALRATGIDVSPALKENGGAGAFAGRWTTGKTLVAGQLAICVVIIAAAGLLVRTLQNLKALDTGFQKVNVLLFDVDTTAVGFPAAQRPPFWAQLLERVRARQGVVSASLSRRSPIDFSMEVRKIEVPGFQSTEVTGISTNSVTPEYFTTFVIGLLRGRAFTAQDHAQAPKVALVSAGMARFFFGESDPIGQSFLLGGGRLRDTWTIVGVVEDVHQERLRDTSPTRMVYTPLAQGSRGLDPRSDTLSHLTVELRTAGDADRLTALAASVRDDVRAASKDAVVSYVRTMDEQLDAALIKENVLATLSTAFGILALLLSAVGLYGVMAYSVARRTREIGIRLALGAVRSAVLWQVLRDTLRVAATGIAIGMAGALILAESVKALLFRLEPRDPATLAASALILLVTAIAAGYLPARKAAAVDPMQALRTE